MADLTLAKDDFGFYINFTVQNYDGSIFNLTTYTITLNVFWVERFVRTLFTGVCAPVVAASGTCRYLVVDGDLSRAGAYKAELDMTKVGVRISTMPYDVTILESA